MNKKENQQRILKKIQKDSKLDPFYSKPISKENKKLCDLMSRKQIEEEVKKYNWLQKINLGKGVTTNGSIKNSEIYLNQLNLLDFKNKKVLDVCCKDGLYSFEAEKRGSDKVIGIDKTLPKGLVEFLSPFFDSKVEFVEEDIYSYDKETDFDIILFFDSLCKLKYPFVAFEKLRQIIKNGGFLIIESAFYIDDNKQEILFCPTKGGVKPSVNSKNTYHKRNTKFFNHIALIENLKLFGFELLNIYPDKRSSINLIERDSMLFKKV